jgi:hypothetical protein
MIRGEWPADKVQRWPLDRPIPYARNARTHDDAQVAQIAASIREWGWTIPVLVDEKGTIIAGHGRVLAARQLGLHEAPVMVARGWSEAQCKEASWSSRASPDSTCPAPRYLYPMVSRRVWGKKQRPRSNGQEATVMTADQRQWLDLSP